MIPKTISIDSFKLRIPLNVCSIIDSTLFDRWILVNSNKLLNDGELQTDEHVFKDKSLPIRRDGITTRYAVERINGVNSDGEKSIIEYCTILINSKLLEKQYFEGINRKTIRFIYVQLMNQNIIYCSFEHFMTLGIVSDLDYKLDLHFKQYQKAFKTMISKAKSSKLSSKGYRHFKGKTNKGLQFSDRRKATVSNPFIKLYVKKIELFENSFIFQNKFLNDILLEDHNSGDLIRIEWTLKNRKFFKDFGIEDLSLRNVIKLEQPQLKTILVEYLKKHLNPRTFKHLINYKGLTPTEKVFVNCLTAYHIREIDINTILSELLSGIGDGGGVQPIKPAERKKRSRMKLKLENLYLKYIESIEQELRLNDELLNFFENIGYNF